MYECTYLVGVQNIGPKQNLTHGISGRNAHLPTFTNNRGEKGRFLNIYDCGLVQRDAGT